MKSCKIILIIIFFIGIENVLSEAPFAPSAPLFNALLHDLSHYKLQQKNHGLRAHRGDLLAHSFWVMYAAHELINTHSAYAEGLSLSKREEYIFFLACLLHDIGKAGRTELFNAINEGYTLHYVQDRAQIFYYSQKEHPYIGFVYLGQHFLASMPHHFYQDLCGKKVDFDQLFRQLEISLEEQKLIAVLVGIHWDFGNVTCNGMTYQIFLSKLQELVNAVRYNNGVITEKLLRMSILIQVADVKGMQHVPCHCCLPQVIHYDFAPTIAQADIQDPWKTFGYTADDNQIPPALLHMKKLIDYFKTSYNQDQ